MYLRPTVLSVNLCVWWIRLLVPVVLAVYVTGLIYVSSSSASDKIILFNVWSVVFLFFVFSNFLYLSFLLIPGLYRIRVHALQSVRAGDAQDSEERFCWLAVPEPFVSIGSGISARTPWRSSFLKGGVVVRVRLLNGFAGPQSCVEEDGVRWIVLDGSEIRELTISVPWTKVGRMLLYAALL